jgi:hypothetical protein
VAGLLGSPKGKPVDVAGLLVYPKLKPPFAGSLPVCGAGLLIPLEPSVVAPKPGLLPNMDPGFAGSEPGNPPLPPGLDVNILFPPELPNMLLDVAPGACVVAGAPNIEPVVAGGFDDPNIPPPLEPNILVLGADPLSLESIFT